MCAVESFARRAAAWVASSAINAGMPGSARLLTRRRASSRSRAEPDAALARKPLHVDDTLQGDRVATIFCIEREGSLTRARTNLCGSERLLEGIGGTRRDERSHDLAAVECNLDAYPLRFSHL